jgi:hypothetical protein
MPSEFSVPTNAANVPTGPDWLHEGRLEASRPRVLRRQNQALAQGKEPRSSGLPQGERRAPGCSALKQAALLRRVDLASVFSPKNGFLVLIRLPVRAAAAGSAASAAGAAAAGSAASGKPHA